ncbi:2OG-Fe(II) oxygenase [Mucilaginibacter lappiensis]|uniref:Rps23 Pro-64 3,4-dihydroxylase Tpa1-like proline 4-hydroxylase n=1 Tax=Mucilaginibacter lappiensis TaxID=354630 RepID=A0A841J783_9SPHI|nr:2OG-Fe(II) oxygenase [Mucilaginibacter lappiensis]MBB6127049.1 Rps23 Pro-64 3,4-dihydroxylase Tpa1-like proline 4-hydroxylase [Mucilaginibacter lappiensis]
MENIDRKSLADLIYSKILSEELIIQKQFDQSKDKIGYFFVDDLLPKNIASYIYERFPKPEQTTLKRSLREYKYIAAQMDKYDSILEEIIYAFQDERIVKLIGKICNIETPLPDSNLYAGGISMMGHENYLNPHLDNSHDKDRNLWRVLNLLYYVTPDWDEKNGGNLEIWPHGVKEEQITIHSKFNRLAIMATHQGSWHSVSPVKIDRIRCCVSNYYFSKEPLLSSDEFHVTSFRGRPEQKTVDAILRVDNSLRMGLRKVFKKGVIENPHVYKKKDEKK